MKRVLAQSHGAAEQGRGCACTLSHDFTNVAFQFRNLTRLATITLDVRRTCKAMRDALRQQHQIALVQSFPALSFRVNPARPLADKVKAQKRLFRKGDVPRVPQFTAPIIYPAKAKVPQDFAESVHGQICRRRFLGRIVNHCANLIAERLTFNPDISSDHDVLAPRTKIWATTRVQPQSDTEMTVLIISYYVLIGKMSDQFSA